MRKLQPRALTLMILMVAACGGQESQLQPRTTFDGKALSTYTYIVRVLAASGAITAAFAGNPAPYGTDNTTPYRLCWHTSLNGSGNLLYGWRCGGNVGLNSSTDWSRVVYQAD